jgi:hypothetical protein
MEEGAQDAPLRVPLYEIRFPHDEKRNGWTAIGHSAWRGVTWPIIEERRRRGLTPGNTHVRPARAVSPAPARKRRGQCGQCGQANGRPGSPPIRLGRHETSWHAICINVCGERAWSALPPISPDRHPIQTKAIPMRRKRLPALLVPGVLAPPRGITLHANDAWRAARRP